MSRLKVFYPVLVATGVVAVIVGIVVLFLYISSPSSFTQKLSQQIQLPNINTDSEKIDTHVIGGNLEVSDGLKTQSLSAQSVATNGIVFGAVSGELKEGMLYKAADGSLRYFNGTDSIVLGATAFALQPTIVGSAIPGPTGAAGADGAVGPSGQAAALPGEGTCPSCADDSLSNLDEVALSSNLLPGADNTVDLGDSGHAFKNGYINNVFAQNVYTTVLDSATASALSIGATNATDINLAQNTTIASDKSLTANGAVLFQNATDTLSAFEVQQASGATVLSVDTVNGRMGIGTATPDYALDVSGDVNVSSGSGYRIDGTQICSASGCTAASGSGHYIQNQNSSQQASSNFWLSGTGRADAGLQAPSLDTSSAGSLSIGTTNATGISLAQNTTVAAGKVFTANGNVQFQNATNSTVAFQVQGADGTTLLRADTVGGALSVGTYVPSTVVTPLPTTTNTYTTGTNPWSIAAADFNGDGKPDLAVANQSSASISVFINAGTGTYLAKVDYATDVGPQSIITADFNGDGRLDIATANYNSNTVSVLIGSGTGTFAAKVDYATGANPRSVTSADFNGDGKPDLAAINQNSNTVSIFIGSGTGTFAAKVDYATGAAQQSVISADFNGDGKPDLAIANGSSNTVSVLIGSGTGTFAAKVDYATGSNAQSVTAADFNGDGKPDLAVANQGSGTASVLIGSGTGTFAAKVDYATGSNPQSVTSADFNADGKPDLAIANSSSNTVSVLIGSGTGTFAAKVDYATGSGPRFVTAADVNTDGQMDIATVGSNLTVIRLAGTTSEVMTQPASRLLINASGATIGQLIQGTAGQTGDLLQVRNDVNTVLFGVSAAGNVTTAGTLAVAGALTTSSTLSVAGASTFSGTMTIVGTVTAQNALNVVNTFTSTGGAVFRRSTNTTTAFSVQQANTTSVFNVDTTNGRVGIGNAAPGNKLSVNALTTADALAQTAIGTGAAGNKGLVMQAVAGQTADLLQAQSSTGAILASISANGTLTVTSAVVTGTLTVNGHVITGGTTPAIVAGIAACASPTVTVAGNDTSGTITVTTGTACAASGTLATLTFSSPFGSNPRIIIVPKNASSTGLQLYNDTTTTTTFTVDAVAVPANTTTYQFNYWTVQ